MEALPPPAEFAADATATVVSPRWLLLNWYGSRTGDDASVAGDARTVAESCTSTGWPFRISFGVAPPPASSFLNITWLAGDPPRGDRNHDDPPTIIAVHDDCVLFELRTPNTNPEMSLFPNRDYFVYDAGAAARPPSLSWLRACHIPMQYERRHGSGGTHRRARARLLEDKDTVVLRRGDDYGDLLVAQLDVTCGDDVPEVYSGNVPRINAEMCVIGGGRGD